jgi:hypothetical protein
MCFTCISEQTAIIALYSINLSFFITKAESVYCAVRTGSLNQTATVSPLKGLIKQVCGALVQSDRVRRDINLFKQVYLSFIVINIVVRCA